MRFARVCAVGRLWRRNDWLRPGNPLIRSGRAFASTDVVFGRRAQGLRGHAPTSGWTAYNLGDAASPAQERSLAACWRGTKAP